MLQRLVATFAGGLLLVAVTVPALGGGSALAFSNNANPNAADGQANAIANCADNILKQNANGQTGSATGNNDHDNKTLNTAVTDCDHFWNQPNN